MNKAHMAKQNDNVCKSQLNGEEEHIIEHGDANKLRTQGSVGTKPSKHSNWLLS
jgi:hypothetical protein